MANLALVSGALHGDSGGLFPIAAKGNTQGLIDAGTAPEFLPGLIDYAAGKEKFAALWQTTLPADGADVTGILDGIEKGTIRALFLAGTNPLINFPESNRWRKALEKLDLLVVQDILANELTEMATVVLPGAATAEKRGSVTSLDQRVNNLRIAVAPPGEARPDLAILSDLFARLTGKPEPSESAIQQEMAAFCDKKQGYAPAVKSLLAATPELTTPEAADLQLLVGKCPFQFGTTTTYSAANHELAPAGLIIINPEDAAKLGVADGGHLKLTGPVGSANGKVMIHAMVPVGLLTAADNFAAMNIQQIVPSGSNCVTVTATKA